ncbi:MAG: hypothetical protein AAF213_04200 [Pseudomonadota bacterium]
MNDAARIIAGIVLLIFLGYAGYTVTTSWMTVRNAEQALNDAVSRADVESDIVQRIGLYNDAYAAVDDVFASRNYFYRLFFGNDAPADALVLNRNLEQALTDCITRSLEECLYPLTEGAGEAGRDEFLRDAHRAQLVDYYTNIAELGRARDLSNAIETPLIRAAVQEELGLRLANLGNRDAALELAGSAAQAIASAEPSLIAAVALTQLSQMLITIGEPGRAITLLQTTVRMIRETPEVNSSASLDKVLALLQLAATASLTGDVATIAATAELLRETDTIDSGPVPKARVEALLVADLARMQGVDAALAQLASLQDDLDIAFAQMLLAQNLALGGELITADEVLQAGIASSQAMGSLLPDELLVEVVGAQAALGYFPAATITLSNIEVPTLQQEGQYLLARYYLYAGRDDDASSLIDALEGTEFSSRLRETRLMALTNRTTEFASVSMAQRVLRFYRHSWKVQLASFLQRLEDRDVLTGFSLLEARAVTISGTDPTLISTEGVRDFLGLATSIRANNSPLPVDGMIDNACQGQGPQCRVDIPFLQGYALRNYVLPNLVRLNLAITSSNG